MTEWWTSLEPAMKVLWAVTLSASLVFVIQTVMTFLGAAGDGDFDINSDFDADMPGDIADGAVDAGAHDVSGHDATHAGGGMNLLTFRNLINFLLGFGWTAILLQDSIPSTPLRLLVAIFVGVLLVAAVMLLFKWLTGMQESGTINVYGAGKVQITINNSVREYEALTDGPALKTGTRIRVVEVISPTTLLVEELNSIII